MQIRREQAVDLDAIDAVVGAAFGGTYEVALVRGLRAAGLVTASLVAEDDGHSIVGHVLFSELGVEIEGRPVPAAALAPVAVRPDRQRQGIGTRLVHEGLAAARDAGAEAVVVLGHAAYYPRFGFSAALARHLEAPFHGDAFMALELVSGALAGTRGSVTYPPPFGIGTPKSGSGGG